MTGNNHHCHLFLHLFLWTVFWFFISPTAGHAATYTVPGDYAAIADALAASQIGDRIEVAPGTYREHHLDLPSGVSLIGTGTTPAEVIIDGQNQGRILTSSGFGPLSRIANISFVNGAANGHNSSERSGGAIYCNNSNLNISACVFSQNTAGTGGAIRCNNASPTVIGCVFAGNTASEGGGAIDCSFNSSPLIQDCTFTANTAAWGGAISCRDQSSPRVATSLLEGNLAIGSRGYGGAIFADYHASPFFDLVTFVGNSARYGGALTCLAGAVPRLARCTITDNSTAVRGGGIFTFDSSPIIERSIISFQSGTGISVMGTGGPQLTCSNIFGNTLGDWTGVIAPQLSGGDNLAADPLFCGTESWVLQPGSASAISGNCGPLGAWPVGCENTGTELIGFSARWEGPHAVLNWETITHGGPAPLYRVSATAENDEHPDSPATWNVLWYSSGDGISRANDPRSSIGAGDRLTYRLYRATTNGTWSLLGTASLGAVPDFPGPRALTAFPNPFNPTTIIGFKLGHPQRMRITVHDLAGRRLTTLADRGFQAGAQQLVWDGRDRHGRALSSGTYVVVLSGQSGQSSLKVTLLK